MFSSTPTHALRPNTHFPRRLSVVCSVIDTGAGTTTPPARDAPIYPPTAGYTYVFPEDGDDVIVTDANFKAQRHRYGECLAHPLRCDCEKVQRPTMDQNEAWQVLALRFKAVRTYGTRSTPLAPLSTGTNAPFERISSDRLFNRANAPHVEDLRKSYKHPLTPVEQSKEQKRIEAVFDSVREKALPPHRPRSRGYGWWRPAGDARAPGPTSSGAEVALERLERAATLLRTERARHAQSIEAVFPRHHARGSTPAVLAVPTRGAAKLKLHAAAHARLQGYLADKKAPPRRTLR